MLQSIQMNDRIAKEITRASSPDRSINGKAYGK